LARSVLFRRGAPAIAAACDSQGDGEENRRKRATRGPARSARHVVSAATAAGARPFSFAVDVFGSSPTSA
jgi:hypothetical protein